MSTFLYVKKYSFFALAVLIVLMQPIAVYAVAYDISTATLTDNFDTSVDTSRASAVAFNADGSNMYVVDNYSISNSTIVVEYALGTNYDASTAVYTDEFDISGEVSNPLDMAFNGDGTKLYIVNDAGGMGGGVDSIVEYTLSVAYDISTAVYPKFDLSNQGDNPRGVAFNSDGTKMFVADDDSMDGNMVNEYTLSTSYAVGTATFVDGFEIVQVDTPTDVVFSSNGLKMFVVDDGMSNTRVAEYTLSVAFDVSSASYDSVFDLSNEGTDAKAIAFSSDGLKMYIADDDSMDGAVINEYTLGSAFDVSTASYGDTYSINAQAKNPGGISFNSSGTRMLVADSGDGMGSSDAVHEYSLSVAFDVSTASYVDYFDISANVQTPTGLRFSADGTQMYVVNDDMSGGSQVFEYALGGSFDVSTASAPLLDVSNEGDAPTGMAFNNDGSKLYVTQDTMMGVSTVSEYALSTNYAVSSGSYTDDFDTSNEGTGARAVAFNGDGSNMYVLDSDGGSTVSSTINEYSLSVAYDVSTASYTDSLNVDDQDSNAYDIAFNNDGTKLYMVGGENKVYEYAIAAGAGGDSGDPVPEMSTYLLILVGGLGAYMLYREADKIDFGGAAAV